MLKTSLIKLTGAYSFSYSFDMHTIKTDWEQVVTNSENIYFSSAYLQAVEKSVLELLRFVYVVIYKDNSPVGVSYFQWLQVGDEFFKQKKFPKEIHSKITAQILKKLNGSLLLCGNFFTTHTNGFYFKEVIPNNIIIVLQNTLQKQLKKEEDFPEIKFVLFKDFFEKDFFEIQESLKQEFVPFQIDDNMLLNVKQFHDFNDYLLAMNTKYRTRAKSVAKKTQALTSRLFNLNDIEFYEKEIEVLYNSVLNEADFNMMVLPSKSFYEFKKQLKASFLFQGYFLDQKLIAFSTSCINNTVMDAVYVGMDYELNTTLPLYQKILYDYVALAIENNVNELRLGRTAETIKSSVGAVPASMNLYVKHTRKITHTVLKPLLKYVKPSSYEMRKPFKKVE